jgi:hypothetical protein
MLLRYPVSSYLYHYGLHARLPFGMLKEIANVCDASQMPVEYLERRRLARDIRRDSPWKGTFPRHDGYCIFDPGDIPGIDGLVEIGREIHDARVDHEADRTEQLARKGQGKSPIIHLLKDEDFAARRDLMDIATSRPLAEIMSDYFGTVPRLDNIDLWVSRPNQQSVGSQQFHLDKPDRHYVSIFVNIFDVKEQNGPLTFLPADESTRVRQATGYERLYYHGDGRLEDTKLRGVSGAENLIRATGPAGAGAIVDTSECLHFGSRCETGERVVMIMTYMLAHKPGQSRFTHLAETFGAGDRLKTLLLGAA